MKYQQKGFGLLVVVLVIAVIAGGGYYVWSKYYKVSPGESKAAGPIPEWMPTANCVNLSNNNYDVNLKWDLLPGASSYLVQKRRWSNLNEKWSNIGRTGSSVNTYTDQTWATTWEYRIAATIASRLIYSLPVVIQVYPNTCPPSITPSPTGT